MPHSRLPAALALIALAAVLLGLGYAMGAAAQPTQVITLRVSDTPYTLNATESELAALYQTVSPAVVSVGIANTVFGELSGGTGFVIDTQGHIVTNTHVIDARRSRDIIEVNFFDGTIVAAQVVGEDRDSDLAVLRVDLPADRLHPVTFADSESLRIGQTALAIGSPFGQEWTLTGGIISGLGRVIDGLGSYQIGAVIQTDAPLNPGNSGGPLLNLRGEVIGVNVQIISRDRANAGIGFAIPSNLVRRVVTELLESGAVQYGYLGVFNVTDMDLATIERLGLPVDTRGVAVGAVEGPAAAAGMQVDDVILSVDGVTVPGVGPLLGYLSTYGAPDQVVTFGVLRDGESLDLAVTLGRRP